MGNLDSIEVDDMLELGGLDNVERQCVSEEEVEEVVRLLVFQGVCEVKLKHQGDSVEALWRKVRTSSTVCALCARW